MFVKPAQVGGTDLVLNAVGHRSDDDPTPIIYVGPTKSFIEKQAEPRLMAMLKSAPKLWAKVTKGKRSTKTLKLISGLPVRLAWAGSATELSSMSAGLGICDERDRMPDDVDGEGDPVGLIEARGSNYPDFTSVIISTPTVGNVTEKKHPDTGMVHWDVTDADDIQSATWKLWQQGTRYEWAWPCPECGEYFIPRFSLLSWPKNSTPYQALRAAQVACPRCGSLIGNEHKNTMNARGVYVAPGQRVDGDGIVTGDPPDSDTASYWVSGLCSPWQSFGQRAKAWLEAVRSGDQSRIQTVLNTGFGELYHMGGDAPPWESVLDLRQPYARDAVPEGVLRIFCCVDVQKNRFVYTVRGWGNSLESWLIREGEIYGDTEFDAVWGELAGLLNAEFDGRTIDLMLIDSGYRPGDRFKRPDNQIYAFARKHRGRVRATKGQQTLEKPFKASMIDVTLGGKVYKKGLQLWHLNTDYFKSFVHGRLEWPVGTPGGWHLYQDVTDDYCQQITAEARVVKPSGHFTWIRIRKDNHMLDCESMQVAAAHMFGLHLLQAPAHRPRPAAPVAPTESGGTPPQSRRRRIVRSNYLR